MVAIATIKTEPITSCLLVRDELHVTQAAEHQARSRQTMPRASSTVARVDTIPERRPGASPSSLSEYTDSKIYTYVLQTDLIPALCSRPGPAKPALPQKPSSVQAPASEQQKFGRLHIFYDFWPADMAKAESLGVDPLFTRAQRACRAYRPCLIDGSSTNGRNSFAYLDYPELVSILHLRRHISPKDLDDYSYHLSQRLSHGLLCTEPPKIGGHPRVANFSRHSVALAMCRTALWAKESNDTIVLQLDKASLQKPSKPVTLTRASGPSTYNNDSTEAVNDASNALVAEHDCDDTTQHVNTLLHADMQEWLDHRSTNFDYQTLLNNIVELAYDRWLRLIDFLDSEDLVLEVDSNQVAREIIKAYAICQRSLEGNIEAFNYMETHGMTMPRVAANWTSLLEKVGRRVTLLKLTLKLPVQRTPLPPTDPRYNLYSHQGSVVDSLSAPSPIVPHYFTHYYQADDVRTVISDSKRRAQERDRSIQRVTYLGGIVSPFTIVSGMFSMSDEFRPGARMFWVFWALSIPLSLCALLVIYADTLRRADLLKPDPDHHGPQFLHGLLGTKTYNIPGKTTPYAQDNNQEPTSTSQSSAASATGFAPIARYDTYPNVQVNMESSFRRRPPQASNNRVPGLPTSEDSHKHFSSSSSYRQPIKPLPQQQFQRHSANNQHYYPPRRQTTNVSFVSSSDANVAAATSPLVSLQGDRYDHDHTGTQGRPAGFDFAYQASSHVPHHQQSSSSMRFKGVTNAPQRRRSPTPPLLRIDTSRRRARSSSAPAAIAWRPQQFASPSPIVSAPIATGSLPDSVYENPYYVINNSPAAGIPPAVPDICHFYGYSPRGEYPSVHMTNLHYGTSPAPGRQDSDLPSGWTRQKLGWVGACKALMGLYIPVPGDDNAYQVKDSPRKHVSPVEKV